MKSNKGFTFIEVIMVISILSILSAMAVNNYRKTVAHDRVKTEADRLYTELKGVRAIALKWDGGAVIRFVSAQRCSIYVDTSYGDPNEELMFYKTYDIQAPVSIGIPEEGPVDGPLNYEWSATGISDTWKPELTMLRRTPSNFTPGAVYIQNTKLKRTTYCIGITADFLNFKMYTWNGSSWIEV